MNPEFPSFMQQVTGAAYTWFAQSLPAVLVVILLVFVGVLLGALAKALIVRLFKRLRVDDVLTATGAVAAVENAGFGLNSGAFVGVLFQWFIVLFFVDIAFDFLHLQAATVFLGSVVLAYLPHILVAAAIVFVAIVIAHRAERAVIASAKKYTTHARTLGTLARAIIVTCAILAALIQLHIAAEMALILFAGIVFALSLAFGIAFGFAGKDLAGRYLHAPSEEEPRST